MLSNELYIIIFSLHNFSHLHSSYFGGRGYAKKIKKNEKGLYISERDILSSAWINYSEFDQYMELYVPGYS
jgi:hypothetical protein